MATNHTNNGNEMNLIDITDLADSELDILLASPDMTAEEFSEDDYSDPNEPDGYGYSDRRANCLHD